MTVTALHPQIAAALAQAQNNAAGVAEAPGSTQLAVQAPATLPAYAVPAPARKITFDDLEHEVSTVDLFLKAEPTGLQLGKNDADSFPELTVVMNMAEQTPCRVVRFGKNPARYYKTYDGANAVGFAGSWAQALAQASQVEPGVRPYPSADLVFRLAAPAGSVGTDKRIGHSAPLSTYKEFKAQVLDPCKDAGWGDADVLVRVFLKKGSNGQNKWVYLGFELLGLATAAE